MTNLRKFPYQLDAGSPPPNFADVIRYGNLTFNDRTSNERALVTGIDGLSGADLRETRETITGADGEFSRQGYQGGRTIVIDGELRAGNLHSLANLRNKVLGNLNLKDKELWFNRYDVADAFQQPVNTRNLIINPSFENVITPWATGGTASGTSGTLIDTVPNAIITGNYAYRTLGTHSNPGHYVVATYLLAPSAPLTARGTLIPVVPGREYSITAHAYTNASFSGATVIAYIEWLTSSLAFVSSTYNTSKLQDASTAGIGRWLHDSGVAPATAAFGRPRLYNVKTTSGGGTLDTIWDAIGIYEGNYTGEWFDGDTPGYTWLGEPHQSTSAPCESVSFSSIKRWPNFLSNGNFADGTLDDWVPGYLLPVTGAIETGTNSAIGDKKLTITTTDTNGGNNYLAKSIDAVPYRGKTLVFSVWVFKPTGFTLGAEGASVNTTHTFNDGIDSGVGPQFSALPSDTWTRVETSLKVGNAATLLNLTLKHPGTNATTVSFAGIRLEEGKTTKGGYDNLALFQQKAPPNSPLPYTTRPSLTLPTYDGQTNKGLALYSEILGAGTLSVVNDSLVPSSTAEKSVISKTGTVYKQAEAILKVLPSTNANPQVSIIFKAATGEELRVGCLASGVVGIRDETSGDLATTTALTAVSGKHFWIRASIKNDLVTVEQWNSQPSGLDSPARTTTYLLTSARKNLWGINALKGIGFYWVPNVETDVINKFVINSIDPCDIVLRNVRKSASVASREAAVGNEYKRPFQVTLRAGDPALYSRYEEDMTYSINTTDKDISLPVENLGNTNTYPIFHITGGYLADLVIVNETTGESFSLSKPLGQKDHLVINFLDQKTEWFGGLSSTGSSAASYIKPVSDRISLAPGANVIRVKASAAAQSPTVRIRFRSAWA